MVRLGDILLGQGLITQAQLDAALARQRREGGRLGNILIAMGVLSVDQLLTTLRNQQSIAPALNACERTLESWQSIYGSMHPNTNRARYNLARTLLAAGRPAEAARLAEAAHANHASALGRDHAWTQEAAQLESEARRAAARLGRPAGEHAA